MKNVVCAMLFAFSLGACVWHHDDRAESNTAPQAERYDPNAHKVDWSDCQAHPYSCKPTPWAR